MKLIAMRAVFITLINSLLSIFSSAQSIEGAIKDEFEKPIASATVSLLKAKDSSAVKFTLTDKEGKYAFLSIQQDSYLVMVSHISYKNYHSSHFNYQRTRLALPAIVLSSNKTELSEVSVQSTRPFIEMKLDKMIINVEASPTNTGANVLEVLAKSPSINVDLDGNISLNGKQGVLILIDGKRTYLSPADLATLLRSMSSSELDQLEIMTTPPAKYDADGMAGLINIKTKKGKNDGWNGNFTTAFRVPIFRQGDVTYLLPITQNNLNFNFKRGKINLYGSTGFNTYRQRLEATFDKTYYTANNDINGSTDITITGKYKGTYAPLSLGLDYDLNRKNLLGFSFSTILKSTGKEERNRHTAVWEGNGQSSGGYTAFQQFSGDYKRTTSNINWKHSLDTLGQEFSIDADYVSYHFPGQRDLITTIAGQQSRLLNNSDPQTYIVAFKADYAKPIKDGRLEGGIKSSFIETKLSNEYLRLQDSKWQNDPALLSRFSYNENIHAVYINMNKRIKKWSIQGGVRMETMKAEGSEKVSGYTLTRNITGLFPSLFTGYDINENSSIKLSYSRRVNRPQFYSLMPYFSIVDSLDIWHGNPDLKPEFSNRVELSYSLKSKYFLTFSYTITENVIRYISAQIGTLKATEFFPMNVETYKNLTLTLSTPAKITKWWDINVFTSLFGNKYYNFQNGATSKSYVTLSQNITNTFRIKKSLKGELLINYSSRTVDQISETEAMLNNFSVGLQKQVLKDKGNLTLNISDPFVWWRYKNYSYFIRLYEVGTFRSPTRSITLSFNYKFGKVNNQARQRNTASQEEQNR